MPILILFIKNRNLFGCLRCLHYISKKITDMTTAKEIINSLPARFKADKVEDDLDIVFHFELSGDEGGEYTVHIKDKACAIEEGLVGEPKCTVKAKAKVYAEVELGKTNPQMAFMMGKIKVSNLNAMLKFADCFERAH